MALCSHILKPRLFYSQNPICQVAALENDPRPATPQASVWVGASWARL
jgi:hypothetical protein